VYVVVANGPAYLCQQLDSRLEGTLSAGRDVDTFLRSLLQAQGYQALPPAGRGRDATLPAWMASGGAPGSRGLPPAPPAR
jgi:hypothetical protein